MEPYKELKRRTEFIVMVSIFFIAFIEVFLKIYGNSDTSKTIFNYYGFPVLYILLYFSINFFKKNLIKYRNLVFYLNFLILLELFILVFIITFLLNLNRINVFSQSTQFFLKLLYFVTLIIFFYIIPLISNYIAVSPLYKEIFKKIIKKTTH